MKRLVLSILVAIFCLTSVAVLASGQERRSRGRQSQSQERAAPGQRAVPRPPQRYNPRQRNYSRQYYYGGRWNYQLPRFDRYRQRYPRGYRVMICQPGYVIFVGYDYRGNPIFQFYDGHCNVPGHYHNRFFDYGY